MDACDVYTRDCFKESEYYENERKILNDLYEDPNLKITIKSVQTDFVDSSQPNQPSDLTFSVGRKPTNRVDFKVHKSVLSNACGVFRTMIEGALSKIKGVEKVEIDDVDSMAFSNFLEYIYQNELTLNGDNVLQIIYLSNKYMMKDLQESCFEYLVENATVDDFFSILETCLFYNESDAKDRLLIFYRDNALEILNHPSLVNISRSLLTKLVHLDSVNVKEIELLKACLKWADKKLEQKYLEYRMTTDIVNEMLPEEIMDTTYKIQIDPREILGEEIIRNIRFPTMTKQEFAEALSSYDLGSLLTQKEINDIKYAISTGRVKDNFIFSIKPRQNYWETCVDRSDSIKIKDSQVLGIDILHFSTNARLFLTGVGVVKKKNSVAVDVVISRLITNNSSQIKKVVMGRYNGTFDSDNYFPIKIPIQKCKVLKPNCQYEIELFYVNDDEIGRKGKYKQCKSIQSKPRSSEAFKRVVPSKLDKNIKFQQPDMDSLFYNVHQIYYAHF